MNPKIRKYVLKPLKIMGWIVGIVIFLLIALTLSLRIPWVQNIVKNKAVNYFKNKTDTVLRLERLYVNFPSSLQLKGLYLEDEQGDTLLYCGNLEADANLWGLFKSKLSISEIRIDSLHANIRNSAQDSTFNYQFLLDAFVPPDTASVQPADSSSGFDFGIYGVSVTHSRVTYDDAFNGIYLHSSVGDLLAEASEFDLNRSVIDISYIHLKNSTGTFKVTKPSTPSADTTATDFQIKGDYASIEGVNFTFDDQPGGIRVVTDVGKAEIEVDTLDITEQNYLARQLVLANAYVSVDIFTTETASVADSSSSSAPIKLMAGSDKVSLTNVDIRYTDHSASMTRGFNPLNFWVRDMDLLTDRVTFKDGYARGTINRIALSEDHGFRLEDFRGSFAFQPEDSYLRDLYARTAHSEISGDLEIGYPSPERMMDELSMNVSMQPTRISLQDIRYFMPDIEQQLPPSLPADLNVHLQGDILGSLDDIQVRNFKVGLLSATSLTATGRVQHIRDIPSLQAEINDFHLHSNTEDIHRLVSDTLLPSTITIPETIDLNGRVNGSLAKGSGTIDLSTSLGGLHSKFALNRDADSTYTYQMQLKTNNLQPGIILNQPALGALDIEAEIDGKGLEPDSMDTRLKATITRLVYNDYAYKELSVTGSVDHGAIRAEASINDENLTFALKGESSVKDSLRNYRADLDLTGIDLYGLKLSPINYKLAGDLHADLTASDMDDLNGEAFITNLIVSRNDVLYSNDSLYFKAQSDKDSTSYHLYSGFVDFDMSGDFSPSILPTSLLDHVNHYYHLRDLDTLRTDGLPEQSFTFNLKIKDPEMLHSLLLPGIEQLTAGNMSGSYSSAKDELHAEVNLYSLIYAGIGLDSLNFDLDSDPDSLDYSLRLTRLYTSGIELANLELVGVVNDNTMDTDLHIRDKTGKDKYLIGGELQSLEDHHFFRFITEKFKLNYKTWEIKDSNAIRFYDNAVWFEDLFMKYDREELKIHSRVTDDKDSVVLVELIKLNLGDIGNIIDDSAALVDGRVNGFLELNMMNGGLAFRSDTRIDNFAVKGDTLGTVAVEGLSDNGRDYKLDLELRNQGNKVHMYGGYQADSVQNLNINLDIDRLNLATIDRITASQVKNMTGYLTGKVRIEGSTTRPEIDGSLRFNKAQFTPTLVNSRFTVDQEEFNVNNNGLSFNGFAIKDKNGNETVINGTISSGDLTVFDLDMNIKSEDFLILDRPIPETFSSKNDDLFYGELKVNSTISIKGTTLLPRIDVDASFGDGSTFAYVIPESTVAAQEQKDVVEWFDQDLEDNPFFNDVSLGADTLTETIKGLDLKATLRANETNELTVVVDPATGDNLTVSGDADLEFKIEPSGNMTLDGRYDVSKGSYHMNFYNLVTREFNIQQGSYILWTGDPLEGRMKITAEYDVRAAPVGVPDFNSKLDFIVYLDIAGQLLKPEISFRLGLAPNAPAPLGVEAWVQQTNRQTDEVNKQVFGLLIFRSFFPDDPLAGGGSGNLAQNTARSSVSKVLSSELSRLSSKIKGVELSVDLDSYEDNSSSSGDVVGRTQLELGLSKEFFNDRVVVKVAGNFDLENQNRQSTGMSEFAGDIRIEYKLTEDGRYRLVGFSENDYDNLQGDIIRTGAGFIFVREYDAFRELFQKPREKKETKNEKKNKDKPTTANE